MTFVEYMSILSVYRVQRPDQIQFHCSRLPGVEDYWWTRLWREIPLKIVHHDKSSLIKHLKLDKSRNQLCKLLAIKVLLDQGGIFIDWNVLVVKNLDPFRRYNFTLGKVIKYCESVDYCWCYTFAFGFYSALFLCNC